MVVGQSATSGLLIKVLSFKVSIANVFVTLIVAKIGNSLPKVLSLPALYVPLGPFALRLKVAKFFDHPEVSQDSNLCSAVPVATNCPPFLSSM